MRIGFKVGPMLPPATPHYIAGEEDQERGVDVGAISNGVDCLGGHQ